MAKKQQEVHCKVFYNSGVIYVWADDVVIKQVRTMDAVTGVRRSPPGSHAVSVDPRYNIDQVARDIFLLGKEMAHRTSIFGFLFKVMKARPLA